MLLAAGDLIDIWVVEKALGAGGMGSVYRCHNRSATRILAAVKVLEASLRNHPGAEERFIREAEILFQIDHPNIVKVRNIRTDTDPPYLEMEFVEGQSLESLLTRGPLPLDQAVKLLQQLVDAVRYLHDKGIRHRDIKPANLLVKADGSLKLVDFGLAMEANVTRITQSGMTFGTVSYAPPEWVNPDLLDPVRWDLYAIGVVFWEMLTGDVAFPVSGQGSARQQAMQVILAKQTAEPLDPGPQFPEPVRRLIRELTQGNPKARPEDAQTVLDRISGFGSLGPNPTMPMPPIDRKDRRTWVDERSQAGTDRPITGRKTSGNQKTIAIRRPVGMVFGAALLGGLVVTTLVAAAAALLGSWRYSQPTVRDVDVVISNVPPGTEVGLALDGALSASRDGWVYHFHQVEPGDRTLDWSMGAGCAATCAPGMASCPAHCGTGAVKTTINPGSGTQTVPLALTPPVERPVTFRAPDAPDATVMVDGKPAIRAAPGVFEATVLPGRYPVVALAGACPQPCDGAACPAGCAGWTQDVDIPWGTGATSIDVPLVAPKAGKQGDKPDRPADKPDRPNDRPAAGGGHLVTAGEFARWLANNPDWGHDEAIAAGRASEGYLEDWSDGKPPNPKAPMVGVSGYAAEAFCQSRGGLAALDAAPLTWAEGPGQPGLEWRTSDGKVVIRGSDGAEILKPSRKDANSLMGMRCAR